LSFPSAKSRKQVEALDIRELDAILQQLNGVFAARMIIRRVVTWVAELPRLVGQFAIDALQELSLVVVKRH
jgi:hypothetical protein